MHPIPDYREYPAPATLRPYVMCLWTQSNSESAITYAHSVLPDACIDIVLMNDEAPFVAGPWEKCFVASLPAGASLVGARFRPGCAAGFLGHPSSALLNQLVPLDALWEKSACARLSSLVSEASGPDRLGAMTTFLTGRMAQMLPPDPAVAAAIQWMAGHRDRRVEELSRWIGLSSRQLRRRFCASVGYSPRTFQKILRFQSLLDLAGHDRERVCLADLAADAGYADQAHMTREVHRFSDKQPTRLLGSAECTLRLSGLIRRSGAGRS